MAERTLWYAAWSGDLRLTRELLAEGADPNQSSQGKTPLMEAVNEPEEFFDDDRLTIAQSLLAAGANVSARDLQGWTALHYATRAQARAAELLLESGADPNSAADDGTTPLHQAAVAGNVQVAKALIAAGADIVRPTEAGLTPLGAARAEYSPDEAPELLRLLDTGSPA
ncbi:MAG TPA: ankyrin repeat domain-containing protein [Acidimicrobiia bacterium]|nr:ankyrin repeat domain-containing protein [Acidimicrobiia bacterium]